MALYMLFTAVALTLDAGIVDECDDLLGPPHGSAGAKLDRLGKTACAAALPPCAFADGDDGKDLGQTEKTVSGDRWMLL